MTLLLVIILMLRPSVVPMRLRSRMLACIMWLCLPSLWLGLGLLGAMSCIRRLLMLLLWGSTGLLLWSLVVVLLRGLGGIRHSLGLLHVCFLLLLLLLLLC